MRAIDFHLHLFNDTTNPYFLASTMQILQDYTQDKIYKRYPLLNYPETLDQHLEAEGIDYAVLLGGNAPCTGFVPNEIIADFSRNSKKLFPFININPGVDFHPERHLEFWVKEMGFRGIKLSPSYNHFYPDQRELYPLYRKAEQLRLPVLFHTGSSYFAGTQLKYVDPLHFDSLAADFPELTIAMAHCGRGMHQQAAFAVSCQRSNVYLELSGLPPGKLLDIFPDFEENADRILFGTDWPSIPKEISDNLAVIRNLPLAPSTIEKILWRNAARLLGLDESGVRNKESGISNKE